MLKRGVLWTDIFLPDFGSTTSLPELMNQRHLTTAAAPSSRCQSPFQMTVSTTCSRFDSEDTKTLFRHS